MTLPSKYIPPIKYLGSAAIILLITGISLPSILGIFLDEDRLQGVLIKALPFLGVFLCILMLFILLIFMVAMRLNTKLPYRTHRPIEVLTIFGIFTGVFFLFQPWQLIGYQYGFLWLLVSTLTFILWSHVVPRSARIEQEYPEYTNYYWAGAGALILFVGIFIQIEYGAYLLLTSILFFILMTYLQPVQTRTDHEIPPITSTHQIVAGVFGLVIAAIVAGALISVNAPAEPYGYSQRQWDRGLRDEQKQEIIDDAETTFVQFTIPFSIFMSLLPGSFVFFVVREIMASSGEFAEMQPQEIASQTVSASTSGG